MPFLTDYFRINPPECAARSLRFLNPVAACSALRRNPMCENYLSFCKALVLFKHIGGLWRVSVEVLPYGASEDLNLV